MWYYAPDGRDYCLLGSDGREKYGMFLIEDGISGLVGESEDSTSNPALFTGQRFYGLSTKAMTGTLTICISPSERKDIDKVMKDFRSAWSRKHSGVLTLIDTDSEGVFRTNVRLRSSISAPKIHPRR